MFKKSEIETKIDEEIMRLLVQMSQETDKEVSGYAAMTDQLVKLQELRHKGGISRETMVTIAANVAGIVAILGYERAGVITSKAFGLVKKIF
jgi:hypothetical protein